MSENKHTPGEWLPSNRIFTTHNNPSRHWEQNVHAIDQLLLVGTAVGETREECEANARLMAAAPVLLAALQEYMSQFGQGLEANGIPYGPSQSNADAGARFAIAKAEGRA